MTNKRYVFWAVAGVFCLVLSMVLIFMMWGRMKSRLAFQERLSNELVRLHVRANSDSDEDQQLKLEVRDTVVECLENAMSGATSKEDALERIQADMDIIGGAAKAVLESQGSEYAVSVYVCREFFPVREYDGIVLPAGEYDALRIDIGEAKGHNWWCVLYPRLCFFGLDAGMNEDMASGAAFTDEAKKLLKESLSQEDYERLMGGNTGKEVRYEFRILKWLNQYI